MTSQTIERPAVNLAFSPINEAQRGFMETGAPRSMFSGAFGAGKTLALCTKALKLSLDYPGNFGLLCRKTRSSMTHTTMKTWWDKVCPGELVVDYNKTEGLVKFHNGSGIIFGGLDDPLKLGSLELGWVGIDEAIETTEDDWRMLEGRLRLPGVLHQIFAATNPGPPAHYLHKLFFEARAEGRAEGSEVYQAGTLENPELPEDYKDRLKSYTGVYYDRYVLGRWTGLEGLVYSSFNEKVCRIKRFEIPKEWLIYTGHDFGGANPAAMFYAQDPATGYFYAWHEYLPGGGRSIYEHVQQFKEITTGRNVIKRAGGSHQEDEIRQGYTAQGWPMSEPLMAHSVAAGIARVFGLHSLNKLFIFDDLTDYLREKLSYAYKKQDGVLTDVIEDKSKFHLMDAERYVISDFAPESVMGSQVVKVQRVGAS